MLGLRPVTPGTIVVAAGTALLIVVSVSVPILKTVSFLDANLNINGTNSTLSMGVWGYCIKGNVVNTCSNSTLGYNLNVDQVFGVSGLAAQIPASIPNSLIKGLTYALILHPIAAGFGLIATLFGILAHIREFSVTSFTTCFASLGATVALLAFVFDVVLFEIAVRRINSSAVGGSAKLGNAVWLTLAGMLCLMFSGCFFGLGRCLIRNRRPDRENNEKSKPVPDPGYASQMRNDAVAGAGAGAGAGYGQGAMYGKDNSFNSGKGGLPAFQDRDGEVIPLTAMARHSDEDEDYSDHDRYRKPSNVAGGSYGGGDGASFVSGVGMGYGKRTNEGMPLSYSNNTLGGPIVPGAAGVGAGGVGGYSAGSGRQCSSLGGEAPRRQGSNLAPPTGLPHSESTMTNNSIQPFTSMSPPPPAQSPPLSDLQHYSNYADYAAQPNYSQAPPVSAPYQYQNAGHATEQLGSYSQHPQQGSYNGMGQQSSYYPPTSQSPPPTQRFSPPQSYAPAPSSMSQAAPSYYSHAPEPHQQQYLPPPNLGTSAFDPNRDSSATFGQQPSFLPNAAPGGMSGQRESDSSFGTARGEQGSVMGGGRYVPGQGITYHPPAQGSGNGYNYDGPRY